MRQFLSDLVRSGLLVAGLLPGFALSAEASQLALRVQAKVTRQQDQKIALAKVPKGKVQSFELEKENGKLVWSSALSLPTSENIAEVQLDAITGEVVSNQVETPAEQAREAAADKVERRVLKQQ